MGYYSWWIEWSGCNPFLPAMQGKEEIIKRNIPAAMDWLYCIGVSQYSLHSMQCRWIPEWSLYAVLFYIERKPLFRCEPLDLPEKVRHIKGFELFGIRYISAMNRYNRYEPLWTICIGGKPLFRCEPLDLPEKVRHIKGFELFGIRYISAMNRYEPLWTNWTSYLWSIRFS